MTMDEKERLDIAREMADTYRDVYGMAGDLYFATRLALKMSPQELMDEIKWTRIALADAKRKRA